MKPTLTCQHCGAPVDRSVAGTLSHIWTDEMPNGTLHGAMVAYRCTNPQRISHHEWGRIRVVVHVDRAGSEATA